jgi:hypothetical protein
MPTPIKRFELSIVGDTSIAWRRWHLTFEAAQREAERVHKRMDASGLPDIGYQRNAHPAVVYGPGCGKDGVTIP